MIAPVGVESVLRFHMSGCKFVLDALPESDVRSDYYYVVRDEDVMGAKTGREVFERAAMYIRYGNASGWEGWGQYGATDLAKANYHNLDFEKQKVKQKYECWPSLLSLQPGTRLRVPKPKDDEEPDDLRFPTTRLTKRSLSIPRAKDRRDLDQSASYDDGGPDDTEDSTSTWLIWGAVALAIGGTWWMMSNKK